MKEELYITFHSEDDIRHFVDTCNEFDDAIDIRIQKMAMDAKSLLGMPAMMMKTITKNSSRPSWKNTT